jgi:EpsI family protein
VPGDKPRWTFLKGRHALVLSVILAAQAAVFYGLSGRETVPAERPLKASPARFGDWKLTTEGVIEREVQEVLRADDVITRVYTDQDSGRLANLFVAYFRTQRAGQAPHSPKNCLPGSGWQPSTSDTVSIPIQGMASPIQVNRYIVERGEEKSIVLYWYQTPRRVIASEYEAKFFLVVDSIRYRRSDTALVRVVSPVIRGDEEGAYNAAIDFIQSFFAPLREYLPG